MEGVTVSLVDCKYIDAPDLFEVVPVNALLCPIPDFLIFNSTTVSIGFTRSDKCEAEDKSRTKRMGMR